MDIAVANPQRTTSKQLLFFHNKIKRITKFMFTKNGWVLLNTLVLQS